VEENDKGEGNDKGKRITKVKGMLGNYKGTRMIRGME
jgi:hypothetical protein